MARLTLAQSPERQPPECDTKIRIVERIDERIDRTVYPAEPRQHGRRRLADGRAWQKRYQQIVDEERKPTDDESADDHAQRLGRLRFALRRRNADGHAFAVRSEAAGDARLTRRRHSLNFGGAAAVRQMMMLVVAAQTRLGQRRLGRTKVDGLIVELMVLVHRGELVVGDCGAGADGRRRLGDLDEFVERVMRLGTLDRLLLVVVVVAEDLVVLAAHRVLARRRLLAALVVHGNGVQVDVVVVGALGCLKQCRTMII